MYNEEQITFLKEKNYLRKDETVYNRIDSICKVVKKYEHLYSEGLSERIKNYITNQILSPSTPQWANVGRESRKNTSDLPCSCNIITVPNSISGIYYSIAETAMLSKLGAGVGADFTGVCEKGTYLDEGFYSNPKLDWMEDLVNASQKVSQSSIRRGYAVPFISIDDVEFYDMLKRVHKTNPNKEDPFVDNNVGVILPSGFRDRVRNGDKEARKRFLELLKRRQDDGKIYILDIDNCNINQSPVYKRLNHTVTSTNICCVTGDQMVATKEGFKTVKQLSDENIPLDLFDNEDVHKSTAMLYRGHADVYKIHLKNGMDHTITSNHELVVRNKNRGFDKRSIETGLKVGDKVKIQTNKGLFGTRNEPGLAFLFGLYAGDGTGSGNSTVISLWENDFDLISEVEGIHHKFCEREDTIISFKSLNKKFVDVKTHDSDVKRKNLSTVVFNNNGFKFQKNEIPNWILEGDEETHWQFLRGLFYADGTVGDYSKGKSFGKPITASLTSININFLKKVQILCANLGLNVKIYNGRNNGFTKLPKNNGTGEYGDYYVKQTYRLVLSNKNDLILFNEKTGFLDRKCVSIEYRSYRDNSLKTSEIVKIEHVGKQDVYCPTVDSEKHLWICNGLVTSNTEVLTPQYDDKTFSCIIASLNLVHWDQIKNNPQIIKDCFMYLDIMVEEYIRLTKDVPFLEKARKSAVEKRDIGLGTLGFHEYIQSKGCAYGDLRSRKINKEIYSTVRKYAEEVTIEMADKLGSPKMCVDAGLIRRNVSLLMIAPNKSTSFLCGNTSPGIEPFKSNYYFKALAGIQSVYKNKYLEKLLEEKGKNTPEVWESILKNLGSVQHLDFLNSDEKLMFRTASEISPKDIIDLAADRQEYIDMAQSINLFNRPNYTLKDIYDIHMYAFDRGIKTLYYFYPQAHAALETENNESWDTCASCQD